MPYVQVDVDLVDVDDDELIEELRDRGYSVSERSFDEHAVMRQLFLAFQQGRTDDAMRIAREVACEATGRIL